MGGRGLLCGSRQEVPRQAGANEGRVAETHMTAKGYADSALAKGVLARPSPPEGASSIASSWAIIGLRIIKVVRSTSENSGE